MGNSTASDFKVSKPADPGQWSFNQRTPYCEIVKNNYTHQIAQQYIVPTPSNIDLLSNFRMYQYRRTHNAYIVGVLHVEKEKGVYLCQGQDFLKVRTERIPFRLSDKRKISEKQAIDILQDALKGYKQLFGFVQGFYINSDMIGWDQNDRIKVWINSNFAINAPETTPTISNKTMSESDLVHQLFSVVQEHVEGGLFSQKTKDILLGRSYITFDQAIKTIELFNARKSLNPIISRNVQNHLECAPNQIYFQRSSQRFSSPPPQLTTKHHTSQSQTFQQVYNISSPNLKIQTPISYGLKKKFTEVKHEKIAQIESNKQQCIKNGEIRISANSPIKNQNSKIMHPKSIKSTFNIEKINDLNFKKIVQQNKIMPNKYFEFKRAQKGVPIDNHQTPPKSVLSDFSKQKISLEKKPKSSNLGNLRLLNHQTLKPYIVKENVTKTKSIQKPHIQGNIFLEAFHNKTPSVKNYQNTSANRIQSGAKFYNFSAKSSNTSYQIIKHPKVVYLPQKNQHNIFQRQPYPIEIIERLDRSFSVNSSVLQNQLINAMNGISGIQYNQNNKQTSKLSVEHSPILNDVNQTVQFPSSVSVDSVRPEIRKIMSGRPIRDDINLQTKILDFENYPNIILQSQNQQQNTKVPNIRYQPFLNQASLQMKYEKLCNQTTPRFQNKSFTRQNSMGSPFNNQIQRLIEQHEEDKKQLLLKIKQYEGSSRINKSKISGCIQLEQTQGSSNYTLKKQDCNRMSNNLNFQ